MTKYNYRYYTKYNTGIILGTFESKYNTGVILGTFGSWVACNAPFILTPCVPRNLIVLISILVTSVLQSWYSASVSSINKRDLEVSSIPPSNHPTMSANQTINPTQALANDSRAQLEPWLEEIETHARNLCAQHDVTGALARSPSSPPIMSGTQSQLIRLLRSGRIAAGDPPHLARPTWAQPQPHANNAAAAVVSLYKMEATRHADYSMASSTLNTAVLASVGEENRKHLKTTVPALKLYMLSPSEIVPMRTKHGVATSDDISKPRDPLSRALTSLLDLTGHMDSFLLASQRLTRSGQGETDYKYFELFLETVWGFPSVPASMAGYYTQYYPAILQQSLATLFSFLENLKDHLTRGAPSSPFSGAAKALQRPATRNRQPRSRPNNNNNRTKQQQQPASTPSYRPNNPTPETTKNRVGDLGARSPCKPPLPAPTRSKSPGCKQSLPI
jgi:hypothetical protein